jgi:hypothetical protein
VRCGVGENRVGDHDRRDVQAVEDVQHLVAVGTSVNSVLVLDYRHVAAIEQFRARHDRSR